VREPTVEVSRRLGGIQLRIVKVVLMFRLLNNAAPDLIVNGDVDAQFAYIPSHIEYILNELLKNAFRATADAHIAKLSSSSSELPPVRVTIAKAKTSPTITIRVRDAGGGIPPEILPKVNAYAFTTVDSSASAASESNSSEEGELDHRDDGPYGVQNAGGGVGLDDVSGLQSNAGHLAGLGFGLPLSKLHCEVNNEHFFGH
jgi:signal transduction histidine kinase